MAQRVQVLLVCDLHDDDTPGTETISFALDGSTYEIDVCDKHAGELRDSFAAYVGAGRRAAGRGAPAARRGRRAASGGSSRDRAGEIRAWAREQGLQVSERGRIPASLVEQYDAAHR